MHTVLAISRYPLVERWFTKVYKPMVELVLPRKEHEASNILGLTCLVLSRLQTAKSMLIVLAVDRYPLVEDGLQKCTSQWLSDYQPVRSMKPNIQAWPYMSSQPPMIIPQI